LGTLPSCICRDGDLLLNVIRFTQTRGARVDLNLIVDHDNFAKRGRVISWQELAGRLRDSRRYFMA